MFPLKMKNILKVIISLSIIFAFVIFLNYDSRRSLAEDNTEISVMITPNSVVIDKLTTIIAHIRNYPTDAKKVRVKINNEIQLTENLNTILEIPSFISHSIDLQQFYTTNFINAFLGELSTSTLDIPTIQKMGREVTLCFGIDPYLPEGEIETLKEHTIQKASINKRYVDGEQICGVESITLDEGVHKIMNLRGYDRNSIDDIELAVDELIPYIIAVQKGITEAELSEDCRSVTKFGYVDWYYNYLDVLLQKLEEERNDETKLIDNMHLFHL